MHEGKGILSREIKGVREEKERQRKEKYVKGGIWVDKKIGVKELRKVSRREEKVRKSILSKGVKGVREEIERK